MLDLVIDAIGLFGPRSGMTGLAPERLSRPRSPPLRARRAPFPPLAEPALPLVDLLANLRELDALREELAFLRTPA